PLQWPINVWVTNLLPLPIIVYGWQRRRAAGVLAPGETPLVVGAVALFVLFLCWLPFDVAHVALAVQVQLSRVFWILDVFATVYVVWWLAEGRPEGLRYTSTTARRSAAGAQAPGPAAARGSSPGGPAFRPADV